MRELAGIAVLGLLVMAVGGAGRHVIAPTAAVDSEIHMAVGHLVTARARFRVADQELETSYLAHRQGPAFRVVAFNWLEARDEEASAERELVLVLAQPSMNRPPSEKP